MRSKLLLLMMVNLVSMTLTAKDQWLIVGTYTGNGSKGIYVYRVNALDKSVQLADSVACENPSYLAVSADGNFVYSITENGNTKPGSVRAYAFDKQVGKLNFINEQPSGGDHPCYVAVSQNGRWVAVANYSGGSLSVLPLKEDGSLMPPAQTIQHYGSSIVKQRQDKPHVHFTEFSPDNNFLFVADLGTDRVIGYPFHADQLQPLDTTNIILIHTKAGAGPRHLEFNKRLPVLYVLEELSGTVSVFDISSRIPQLLQTIISDSSSPLPDRGSADIHISPDGKFLYSSNRGISNSISIFSVDQKTGKLTLLKTTSSMGEKPRNFVIDPLGRFLVVANQSSDNVVFFKRDEETGLLAEMELQIKIPSPVCLKLLEIPE